MHVRTVTGVLAILLAAAPACAQDDTRKLWKHSDGAFEHVAGKTWTETHVSGATFEWTEKERTKQQIKLYDAKRKVTIALGAASAVVQTAAGKSNYKGAWADAPLTPNVAKGPPVAAPKEEKLPPLTPEEIKNLEWIREITLRPAFGGDRSGTRRWMRSPTLSVMKASTEQANLVAEGVKEINELLAKTPIKEIKVIAVDDDKADILVYVAPQDQLPKLGKAHDLDVSGDHNVSSIGKTNQQYEMQRGFVFISDKLTGASLRTASLWGILGTLGFQQTSQVMPDSIFAGKGNGLSDADRTLIVFFYNHVQPMVEDREIRMMYQKHWPK